MGVGITNKKKKQNDDVKNNLLGNETWTCPCCHTKHGNDKRPIRPYLSCCEAWTKMGIKKMIEVAKK